MASSMGVTKIFLLKYPNSLAYAGYTHKCFEHVYASIKPLSSLILANYSKPTLTKIFQQASLTKFIMSALKCI